MTDDVQSDKGDTEETKCDDTECDDAQPDDTQYKTEITIHGPEDMLDAAQKILLAHDPTFYKFKRKDGTIKAKFYMRDDKKAALEAELEVVDETVADDVHHFVIVEEK